jgi:glycosyltransferase involved in cell wall biosynthesis
MNDKNTNHHIKCAIVGSYLPRHCGIATFSNDLYDSISDGIDTEIVAVNDPDQKYNYPEEVKYTLEEEDLSDYSKAADYINQQADICLLQHEYNLFGGDEGIYILSLLNKLEVPLITTLHTVLKEPSITQNYILREIGKLSRKVVVISQVASDIVQSEYDIPRYKIEMIRHGVPDIQFDQQESKNKLGLSGKKVMLTFGLLDRNKGVETVLKALPAVIEKHTEVKYLVVGKTHPIIIKKIGEEYRNFLEKLVKEKHLEDHVSFINRFVEKEELYDYLSAMDILITPYLNEAQVSSGPLSFAMGTESVIISTPFWHANELLSQGRGRLFDFKNHEELCEILLDILDHPKTMDKIKKNVSNFGKRILWPVIGQDYLSLLHSELEAYKTRRLRSVKREKFVYPKISFRHIQNLTDSTGIISDAIFGFPNLKNGYRLEDNARALLAIILAYSKMKKKEFLSMMATYLSFLQLMQNKDGTFSDTMKYNREVLRDKKSDTGQGLAIWALGHLINHSPNYGFRELAGSLFQQSMPATDKIKSLRGKAYALMGFCNFLDAFKVDQLATERLFRITRQMIDQYRQNKSENWHWFGQEIGFDSAILPLSLMYASQVTKEKEMKTVAFDTMDFLTKEVIRDGQLSLIGNKQWYKKGGERSIFDQLPVDAMGMILLYKQAYELTENRYYFHLMQVCFNWFFGKNDLYIYLYDPNTKGCYDGLQANGVNRNQGAESSLAFQISNICYQEVAAQIKKSLQNDNNQEK